MTSRTRYETSHYDVPKEAFDAIPFPCKTAEGQSWKVQKKGDWSQVWYCEPTPTDQGAQE